MDPHNIIQLFSKSFDPNSHQAVERELHALDQTPGFPTCLIQIFSHQEVQMPIKQAAVIYFKNLVIRSWEVRSDLEEERFVIHDQDKESIRNNIIELIISSHDLVRVQLNECIYHIFKWDYPERWPGVPEKLFNYFSSSDQTLWMGCLHCTHQLVKKYSYKKAEERGGLNIALVRLLPVMQERCLFFMNDESIAPVALQTLVMKIFAKMIESCLPLELITERNFPSWMEIFYTILNRDVPQMVSELDEDEQARSVWWKCKKWCMRVILHLFKRYGQTNLVCDKDYIGFAKFFSDNYAVRSHERTDQCQSCSVSHAKSWKVVQPHIQEIVRDIALPLLSHGDDDDELWTNDPQEYIRVKYDIFEDFFTLSNSVGCMLDAACNKRKGVLDSSMALCYSILVTPSDQRDPRKVDGALHMIGCLSKVLFKRKNYKSQLEEMLTQHVYPEFNSNFGYLRARACWVMKEMSGLKFRNKNNLAVAVEMILKCLSTDPELPVRVEAALALQHVIQKQEETVSPFIEPHIKTIIVELVKVLKVTEAEDLSGAIDSLISSFSAQIAEVAVEITENLATTLMHLVEDNNDMENSNRALMAMSVINTIETVMNVMEESAEIMSQIEKVVAKIIVYFLENCIFELYEEVLSLVFACTGKRISEVMWSVYFIIYETFKRDAIDYFTEMVPCLHNYVTVDTDAFLSEPRRLEALFDMCKGVLEVEQGYEENYTYAAKVLELTVLQCRGRIDNSLPHFIHVCLERISKGMKVTECRTMCLQVVIACLYTNVTLTLQVLETLKLSTANPPLTQGFMKQWVNYMDSFLGLHDRKVCVLGLIAVLNLPRENRPPGVTFFGSQYIRSFVMLFQGLERAYACRAAEDSDSESDDDDDSSEELASDEDECEDEDVVELAAKAGLALEAYEAADDLVEETQLEAYTTIVDDEDTVDEYWEFKNMLANLSETDPRWYESIMRPLDPTQQKYLDSIMVLAEQRRAAQVSRRIKEQGGYSFGAPSIPTEFKFG